MNTKQVIEEGCEWLREYMKSAGKKKVVIGLSGGLDSATVAFWAAKALGRENLILITMPYGANHERCFLDRSNPESEKDAYFVTQVLRGNTYMESYTVSITEAVDAIADAIGLVYDTDDRNSMAANNLKARMRAVVLRTEANRHDALLLGTENLTEHMLGYFTIGGDEESDLELLSTFTKTQVRTLARELGVPERIINKAPSADLWAGQTDEDELGFTYEQADQWISNEDFTFGAEIAKSIQARCEATRFKRQAKPVFQPTVRG